MEKIKLIAYWATGIITIIIIIASFVFAKNSINAFPQPPALAVNGDLATQEIKKKEIENFEKLSAAVQKQRTDVYDTVITKTVEKILNLLLPAVLTFIFAIKGLEVFKTYLKEKQTKP
jgi:hypothetical protein